MSDTLNAVVQGAPDRTISPVSSSAAPARAGRKAAGTLGLALLCGALLWMSWKRAPAETPSRTEPTIAVTAAFERARETAPTPRAAPVPQAAPEPLIPRPPPVVPSGQRNERSPAEELLDSSRRAPVLVYNRAPTTRVGGASAPAAPEETTGAISDRPVSGAPEPRNELADRLRPTPIEGVRAARLPNRSLLIAQGTVVPCVLETAMSSDVPGFVSCTVSRDVMSDDGHVVLMERGTQVVGEYRGQVRRGSSRMFVLWTRAKTPTGVIVALGSPATDGLGRAGFDGQIDAHFWERFGGALLLSIVGDAGQIAGQQLSEGGVQITTAQRGGGTAAAIATEQSINIPPTLIKNQGELVSIFVARDLDFSSVYGLRVGGGRTEGLDRSARQGSRPVFKP